MPHDLPLRGRHRRDIHRSGRRERDDGRGGRAKTLSTPASLRGGLRELDKAGIPADVAFVHGSTVAINAVLQETGAKTALLTTKGFRDCPRWAARTGPTCTTCSSRRTRIVPGPRRFEVPERLGADGTVRALDDEQVRTVVSELPPDTESVAICFLHSYAWPAHDGEPRGSRARSRPDCSCRVRRTCHARLASTSARAPLW